MRRAAAVCITLLALLGAGVCRAAASDTVEGLLAQRWYEVEFFVFERPTVLEYQSRERLVSPRPRPYPAAVHAYLEPGEALGAAYVVDPETVLCMTFPSIDYLGLDVLPEEGGTEGTLGEQEPPFEPDLVPPVTPASEPPGAATQAPVDPFARLKQGVADFEATLAEAANAWQPAKSFTLSSEARRLERGRQGRILFHGRWLQAVPPRETPEPVMVTGGIQLGGLTELTGSAAVTVGRYLHFRVALNYTAPVLGQAPVTVAMAGDGTSNLETSPPGPREFMVLAESRRMRSGELHYLDHPKLGVVVRIDPVAIPDDLLALAQSAEKGVEEGVE